MLLLNMMYSVHLPAIVVDSSAAYDVSHGYISTSLEIICTFFMRT